MEMPGWGKAESELLELLAYVLTSVILNDFCMPFECTLEIFPYTEKCYFWYTGLMTIINRLDLRGNITPLEEKNQNMKTRNALKSTLSSISCGRFNNC